MTNKYESFGLYDNFAIIIGPTQGIGRALALGLAEAGAHVALVSRTQAALEDVAAEIEAMGRRTLVISADLQDVEQIRAMVGRVHEAFGRIDLLVNSAAWTATVPTLEVTEEEWDQTLDTCLKAVFFTCQAVAKIMVEQGGGKIVNLGSTLAEVAFARRAVYSAAKSGIHHLTRSLANEWAALGISVNSVAPCVTETPTRANLFNDSEYVKFAMGMLPIGRWGQPEDFVGAMLFLCSDLSEMVVGHNLMVDGGWTIH